MKVKNFLGICFIVFTTKKQPNATATCVILQMNLPQKNNKGFFNFEEVLKMTILKTKIAEC